jgi:hypothetical protein
MVFVAPVCGLPQDVAASSAPEPVASAVDSLLRHLFDVKRFIVSDLILGLNVGDHLLGTSNLGASNFRVPSFNRARAAVTASCSLLSIQPDANPKLFDGKRMIFGGFQAIVEA